MSLQPYEPIDESRLLEICKQAVAESQTLDIKQTLPGTADRDKAEFLKDVCAMANSSGGDIVYGVAEQAGTANAIQPISAEQPDAAKRRLGQVADSGLEPRVIGLQFRDIPVNGGYVLLVRVPASFNGPHRYNVSGIGRFVIRNGTHTAELTYEQLRTAFDRTATLGEKARRFRAARISAIQSLQVGSGLVGGPKAVAHLIPLSAMSDRAAVDMNQLYQHPRYAEFMFPHWRGGLSRAVNLDGLLVSNETGGKIRSYAQVFRSGVIEAVKESSASGGGPANIIPGVPVTLFFHDIIGYFFKHSQQLNLSGPAIIGAALLTVGTYEFALNPERGFSRSKADRNDLVFPEIWIEQLADPQPDIEQFARPLLDVLWQAFDIERCFEYDDQGRWSLPT